MDREQILRPHDVEALIADGHAIVIANGKVLKLDNWLDKHPGGRLVIEHMVGRDATDEINAYHLAPTLKRMNAFQIGRISTTHPWPNFTPPIRGGVFGKAGQPSITIQSDDSEDSSSVASSSDRRESFSYSFNSSNTSVNLIDDEPVITPDGMKQMHTSDAFLAVREPCRKRKGDTSAGPALPSYAVTRDARIALLVRKEINENIRDNPSIDAETQRQITREYQALHERVKAEGYYNCRYIEYGKEAVRYCMLFSGFAILLRMEFYIMSAICLGLFWHQIMFTAHDAGHRGITKSFVKDTLIGMFVADFCCGLSIGWWKSSHNVHHLITNHPSHDPDIQNLPLFSTCPTFFKSLTSTYYANFVQVWDRAAEILIPYQNYTYYPIMGVARFNLYFLSWIHLLSPRSTNLGSAAWTRYAEIICMAGYWYLFFYRLVLLTIPTWSLRIAFVLVSHIVTMPLHVQITLSHWGMSTADLGEGESFAQRQLRTTMDVDCPAWMDFVHGGLQFQAVHHLFPRVPRHNLRRLQKLVMEFCASTGVEYQCLGFVDGNRKVLGRLEEVARMAEVLVECQKYMAQTGESGLH